MLRVYSACCGALAVSDMLRNPKPTALPRNSGLESKHRWCNFRQEHAVKCSRHCNRRSSTEFYGIPRPSVDFHGLLWTSTDFCGLPWTSLDFHGLLWTSRDFCGHPRFLLFVVFQRFRTTAWNSMTCVLLMLSRTAEVASGATTHKCRILCVSVTNLQLNQTVTLSSMRYRFSWTAPFNLLGNNDNA